MIIMIDKLMENEMPREKLIRYGAENLTDVELLAIILRVGVKGKNVIELSREVLSKFSLPLASRKTYDELLEFNGINKAKACQIVAVFELSRRFSTKENNNLKIKINSSKDVYEYVKYDFDSLQFEKVMCVFVDSKNQIIKKEFVSEGSLNFSIIEPRKIIKLALIYNAYGFFLIHNHPSGDTTPSLEDINLTKKIKEITKKLDLYFLDHIIVGNNYYSFYDSNEL